MLNVYNAKYISKLHIVNGGDIYPDDYNLSQQDNQMIPKATSIKTGYEIVLISSTCKNIKNRGAKNAIIKSRTST